jgi:hypothetical protein
MPTVLQNDIKKFYSIKGTSPVIEIGFSPIMIEIEISQSGSKYLRLTRYGGHVGSFGFVTGANKDEVPYDKAAPEYRTEIDDKSFTWIRPRWIQGLGEKGVREK